MIKTDKRKRDTNRCCRCGIVKTKENTGKHKNAPNGFQYMCRKCSTVYRRNYRKMVYNEGRVFVHHNVGIDSIKQVDSVLREMSELQHQIDTENSLCEERKKMIEDYTKELNEPILAHQFHLRKMLSDFIKKTWPGSKNKTENFRFGSVSIKKGELVSLVLKPELAGARRGKP